MRIGKRGPGVVSPDFYLTQNPDSAKELDAHLLKFHSKEGLKFACQFPQRYRWLAKRFDLPAFDLTACKRLSQFVQSFPVGTIELALASENITSSASAFGHIMLVFRPSKAPLETADVVHFAALSDPNDRIFSYIYRGLSGKYEGAYIRDPFFKKYYEYVVTEQRYLFLYQLDVNPEQRLSLLYHLWELRHARFRYFFKDENCAYQIGALLAVIKDHPAGFESNSIVLPIDIVQTQRPIIQKIEHFAPLSRRIERHLSAMSSDEQKQFFDLIHGSQDLEPTSDLVKSAAADYALYKFRTNRKDDVPNFAKLRDLIFKEPDLPTEDEVDPLSQTRSRTLYIGLGHQDKASYGLLRFKPVQHGLIEPKESRTRESEMLLLDTSLRFSKEGHISLENFTLLSTKLLAKQRAPFFPISWGVFAGLRRQNPGHELKAETEFSIGLAKEVLHHLTLSTFLTGGYSWGSGQRYFYAAPQVIASYYFSPEWKLSFSGLSKHSTAEVLNSLEATSAFIWKAHIWQLGASTEAKSANRNISFSYGYSL